MSAINEIQKLFTNTFTSKGSDSAAIQASNTDDPKALKKKEMIVPMVAYNPGYVDVSNVSVFNAKPSNDTENV